MKIKDRFWVWLEKWVLRELHKREILEFRTHKSLTCYEQYTYIYFLGKCIKKVTWSLLEVRNRVKL